MRIGRFEFGIARKLDGSIASAMWGIDNCACHCTIYNIGWFYFTILRGECLHNGSVVLEDDWGCENED